MPPTPAVNGTTVGPRFACASDVDTGTTITDRHPGVSLNPSCDTTITRRVPCCSDPDRGESDAQYTSPRFTLVAPPRHPHELQAALLHSPLPIARPSPPAFRPRPAHKPR